MTDKVTEAVVGVARRHTGDAVQEIIQLSTGYHAQIRSISLHLIFEAQQSVEKPEVPMWMNEEKGREEPNPDDPKYLEALAEHSQQQQMAIADVMIMFGVDVVDADGNILHAPSDDEWIDKLKLRNRLGYSRVDLDAFDLTSQVERDFLFKKYYVVGAADISTLMELYDFMSEEDVAEAEESFRDNS